MHNSAPHACSSPPGYAPTSVHLPIKWQDVEVVNLENSIWILAKKGPFAPKMSLGEKMFKDFFVAGDDFQTQSLNTFLNLKENTS